MKPYNISKYNIIKHKQWFNPYKVISVQNNSYQRQASTTTNGIQTELNKDFENKKTVQWLKFKIL